MFGRLSMSGQYALRVLLIIVVTSLTTAILTCFVVSELNGLDIFADKNIELTEGVEVDDLVDSRCNCGKAMERSIDERYLNAPEYREIVTHPPDETCEKRLPHVLIIGRPQSDTEALGALLSAHPQVAGSGKVTTNFFSAHYTNPLSWYQDSMPCSYSNQVTVETAPDYFEKPVYVRRVHKWNRTVKIIVVLNDPIIAAEEIFERRRQLKRGKYLRESFTQTVTADKKTVFENSPVIKPLSSNNNLLELVESFKRHRLLFVNSQTLETNPANELNIIENFLGIGTYFKPDNFVTNEDNYCFKADGDKFGLACFNRHSAGTGPKYGNDVRKLLENYFRPLNVQISQAINRHFTWGY